MHIAVRHSLLFLCAFLLHETQTPLSSMLWGPLSGAGLTLSPPELLPRAAFTCTSSVCACTEAAVFTVDDLLTPQIHAQVS